MNDRIAALAVWLLVLVGAIGLATPPARAAGFEENDTTRLAAVSQAIKSFEDDVSSALHDLPSNDAELIESYAYVELNLEAAHERLNTVFMLVAVSIYLESSSDQLLIASVMHGQLLPQSKNFLQEKQNAIASMAAAHPANQIFAAYSDRAKVIFRDRAIPLLDELSRRIGDLQR
jgi:hypothetical protein